MADRNLDLNMPPEDFLEAVFEENYQALRLEAGRALAPNIKDAARRQVQLYWQKLAPLADSVTDTEVRLVLPNQVSPGKRRYSIEGVVDIVREQGFCVMYDIKSMPADSIRNNQEWFEQQLNVYAHIWQNLRGEQLDQTAIIATAPPDEVEDAWDSGQMDRLEYHMIQWNPIVPLEFDAERVDETVASFGDVVDQIEDGAFEPPPPDFLNSRQSQTNKPFATDVCSECDARYSCESYLRWSAGRPRRQVRGIVRDYLIEDILWEEANLAETPDRESLDQDYIER